MKGIEGSGEAVDYGYWRSVKQSYPFESTAGSRSEWAGWHVCSDSRQKETTTSTEQEDKEATKLAETTVWQRLDEELG